MIADSLSVNEGNGINRNNEFALAESAGKTTTIVIHWRRGQRFSVKSLPRFPSAGHDCSTPDYSADLRIRTGPSNPDGSSGESFVKCRHVANVYRPFDGRCSFFNSQSGQRSRLPSFPYSASGGWNSSPISRFGHRFATSISSLFALF